MMKDKVVRYMYEVEEPRTTEHIAHSLGVPVRELQDLLVEMDDEGVLMMRNGWYRLSAATLVLERGRRLAL